MEFVHGGERCTVTEQSPSLPFMDAKAPREEPRSLDTESIRGDEGSTEKIAVHGDEGCMEKSQARSTWSSSPRTAQEPVFGGWALAHRIFGIRHEVSSVLRLLKVFNRSSKGLIQPTVHNSPHHPLARSHAAGPQLPAQFPIYNINQPAEGHQFPSPRTNALPPKLYLKEPQIPSFCFKPTPDPKLPRKMDAEEALTLRARRRRNNQKHRSLAPDRRPPPKPTMIDMPAPEKKVFKTKSSVRKASAAAQPAAPPTAPASPPAAPAAPPAANRALELGLDTPSNRPPQTK